LFRVGSIRDFPDFLNQPDFPGLRDPVDGVGAVVVVVVLLGVAGLRVLIVLPLS
jgi:hypothetical protein